MGSLPDLTISQAGNPISGTMLKLFCLSINGVTSLIGKAPVCETGRYRFESVVSPKCILSI